LVRKKVEPITVSYRHPAFHPISASLPQHTPAKSYWHQKTTVLAADTPPRPPSWLAITQAQSPRCAQAPSMPEGPRSGRSEATSIDGDEHSATMKRVMA
jgi:hypothetical protein